MSSDSLTKAAVDVVVAGSINVDLAVGVAALPKPGETVIVTGTRGRAVGGKGANQAAAVAAMGVSTAMAGATGTDEDGHYLRAELAARDVQTTALGREPGRSGWAHILVAPDGENLIVVDPGANAAFTPAAARAAVVTHRPRVVLVQLEIPVASALAALEAGRDLSAVTICNASPSVDPDLLRDHPADIVIVNQWEACRLAGRTDVDQAGACLAGEVADTVITTLGSDGAMIYTDGQAHHVPAVPPTRVIDTTGAGDVFAGVLVAGIAGGSHLGVAVELAVRAGSWSVARAGVACPRPPDLADAVPTTT